LRIFGWLGAFTLIAALAGDLVILPATAVFLRRLIRSMRGEQDAPLPAVAQSDPDGHPSDA